MPQAISGETEQLNEVNASVEIADGRVSMSGEIDTDLYLDTPEVAPLSENERHATLRVADDDVAVEIELDAEAFDALADAIYHEQTDE